MHGEACEAGGRFEEEGEGRPGSGEYDEFGGDVGLDQTRGQDATGIDFATQSTSVSHEQSCGNIMDRPAVFENPQCLAT